jgi:hypothetical protein
MARVAVAAALGLACGCSSMSSSCSDCSPSWTSRLTGLFHRNRAPVEVVGSPFEGPPIADPGPGPYPYNGPGCEPLPQTGPPPLFPPPRPFGTNEAQRMPYQP